MDTKADNPEDKMYESVEVDSHSSQAYKLIEKRIRRYIAREVKRQIKEDRKHPTKVIVYFDKEGMHYVQNRNK